MLYFQNYYVFLPLMIISILTNSAEPDEMPHVFCSISSGSSLLVKVPVYYFPGSKQLMHNTCLAIGLLMCIEIKSFLCKTGKYFHSVLDPVVDILIG